MGSSHGIYQEFVLHPSLDPWTPSGSAQGTHGPMNYVPTYSHTYIQGMNPLLLRAVGGGGLQEGPRVFWIFILALLFFLHWLCFA